MADVIVHDWHIPDNCVSCPFFHVVVANAGNSSYIHCRVTTSRLSLDLIEELQKRRAKFCPLESPEEDSHDKLSEDIQHVGYDRAQLGYEK